VAETKEIIRPSDGRVDALLGATQWDEDSLSYSFPQSGSDYGIDYGAAIRATAAAANTEQRNVFFDLLDAGDEGSSVFESFSLEGLTDLDFEFAGNNGDGDIRIARNSAYDTAYANLPSENPQGGDVWLGLSTTLPVIGTNGYHTLLHELGHAMGLKHPHEGTPVLNRAWDSPEYTVMSYRPYANSSGFGYSYEAFGAPQTFMMLDIAALQHLYGADYSTNSGDTVYSWSPDSGDTTIDGEAALAPGANRIFATIWDGGGRDTFDLSAYDSDLVVDLNPGGTSTFSEDQLAYLGDDVYASGNIYNALLSDGDGRARIENATGGTGDDLVSGNVASNLIRGGEGNDTLLGGSGNDRIYADVGADRLRGGPGNDSLYGGDGSDLIDGGSDADRLYGSAGPDTMLGGSGDDRLFGGTSADVLDGGSGDDLLAGQDGNDALTGGTGSDSLLGGAGPDRFVFDTAAESQPRLGDRILPDGATAAFEGAGVAGGDVIDLRAIDGNSELSGNQSFVFGTGDGQIGEVWLDQRNGDTRVLANNDSDPGVDLVIFIEDGALRPEDYSADDFLL
jgi:serralysin